MYGSSFYKFAAMNKLRGCYKFAVLGSLIFLIPQYLMTQILQITIDKIGAMWLWLLRILFEVFISNIFQVGYYRFLLKIKPPEEAEGKERCDYNYILSGYTVSFKSTLKTTFLRYIRIILLGFLAILPCAVFTTAMMYAIYKSPEYPQFVQLFSDFTVSPTEDTLFKIAEFFEKNLHTLNYFSIISIIASILLAIPLIRKFYRYAMIPMLIAANPDMTSDQAFKRTGDIMIGYRPRYFFLQLSFILYYFAIFIVTSYSSLFGYIIEALILPYMSMTYLQFFIERNAVIEYNIDTYGETIE